MVSSGVITHEFIRELDPSIKLMNFVPRHKNNLSNEFSLQCNFDADQYLKDSWMILTLSDLIWPNLDDVW